MIHRGRIFRSRFFSFLFRQYATEARKNPAVFLRFFGEIPLDISAVLLYNAQVPKNFFHAFPEVFSIKHTIDMTLGSPTKSILLFSIPVMLGSLFQQLYNMTDTFIVGRFLGENALAAVGSTGSIVFLVIGFTAGLTQGFGILTAQFFGARMQQQIKKVLAASLVLTLVISVLVTIPAVSLCRQILVWMNTPQDILELSYSYLVIIFWGILCTMSYNVLASILQAMGDSKTPLYFLILSSFLNIVLDIGFIVLFHMGPAGVALATVVSQGISAVLCFLYLLKNYPHLRPEREDFRLDWRLVLRMMETGIPMAMNQIVIAGGVMIVQSGINGFGPAVIAAYATANKVENLAVQPMIAVSTGLSTYCGQNLGAGNKDRIYRGMRSGVLLGTALAVAGMVFYYAAGLPMVRLFVSEPSQELLHYAELYMFTVVWFLPPLAWIFLYRSAMIGLGKGVVSVTGGILELVSRILCIRFLLPVIGFWCIRLINPITWTATAVLFIILYYRWERQQKKLAA